MADKTAAQPVAWQPIETAPRDGTWFLVFNGHWRGVARYHAPAYDDDPVWVDEHMEFIETPPPTHWMPLPAAPGDAAPAPSQDVDSLAKVLHAAFAKAEPDHPISLHPASWWATFADMARAALATAPSQPAAQPAGEPVAQLAAWLRSQACGGDNYNRRITACADALAAAAEREAALQRRLSNLTHEADSLRDERDEARADLAAAQQDAARLDAITLYRDDGACWRVTYEKRPGKPVRYRMLDNAEPWGQWHDTPRAAIDALLADKGGA